MDTIDHNVMQHAAEAVEEVLLLRSNRIIHTVTVILNGQHGGADVIIEGFEDDEHVFQFTETKEVK